MRERLIQMHALVGESDHGVSKSLYGKDIDGIEFEVMWAVPASERPVDEPPFTKRLDLDAEVAKRS